MNIENLKDLEAEFLDEYPKGFDDERLLKLMKKFNPDKLEKISKEAFDKKNFSQPDLICQNFINIISKSVVISFYDKLKLKDAFINMGMYEKDMFSIALYDILYKNKKEGFDSIVEILSKYNLAKWTLITIIPYYMNRKNDYFIKPTTSKNIINYLELDNLIYKPRPSYEFYVNYKKNLDKLKKVTQKSFTKDNICFTAFLRLGIEICITH